MKLHKLPTHTKGGIHVVIESARGAELKFKYDAKLGVFLAKRSLPLGYAYPYDWGFVPGTRGPDGDPADVLVYWDVASATGAVLRCRLIGVLKLEQRDDGERTRNDRLVAVPLDHDRTDRIRSVKSLHKRVRADLENFFTSQVYSSSKDPRILGWGGPGAAEEILESCLRPSGANVLRIAR